MVVKNLEIVVFSSVWGVQLHRRKQQNSMKGCPIEISKRQLLYWILWKVNPKSGYGMKQGCWDKAGNKPSRGFIKPEDGA